MDVNYLRMVARRRLQKLAAEDLKKPKNLAPVQTASTPTAKPAATPAATAVKPITETGTYTPSIGDTPEAMSVIQRRQANKPAPVMQQPAAQQPAIMPNQQPAPVTAQQAPAGDKASMYATDGPAPAPKSNAAPTYNAAATAAKPIATVSQQPIYPQVAQQPIQPATQQPASMQPAQQPAATNSMDDWDDPRYGSDPSKKFEQGGYYAAQWRDYMPEHERRMQTDPEYKAEHERRMQGSYSYREAFERGKDWLARDKKLSDDRVKFEGDLDDDISKYTKDYFITNAREHGDKMRTDEAYRDRHEHRMKSDAGYRNAFIGARSEAMSNQYKDGGDWNLFSPSTWFGSQIGKVDSNWQDKAIDLAETGRKPPTENAVIKQEIAQERVNNEIKYGKTYANAEDQKLAETIRTKLNNGNDVRGNTAHVDAMRTLNLLDGKIRDLENTKNLTPQQQAELKKLRHNRSIVYTEMNNHQRKLDLEGGVSGAVGRTVGAAALQNVVGAASSVGLGGWAADKMGVDHEAMAETGVLSEKDQRNARITGGFAGNVALSAAGSGIVARAGKHLTGAAAKALSVGKTILPVADIGTKINTAKGVAKAVWDVGSLGAAAAAEAGAAPEVDDYDGARANKQYKRDVNVATFTGLDAASQKQIVRDFASQQAQSYSDKYVGQEREISDAAARYNYLCRYKEAGGDVDPETALAGLSKEDADVIRNDAGLRGSDRSGQAEAYHALRKNVRNEALELAGTKTEGGYWNNNVWNKITGNQMSDAKRNSAVRAGGTEAANRLGIDDIETLYDNKDNAGKNNKYRSFNMAMGGMGFSDSNPARAQARKELEAAAKGRVWNLVKEDPLNNTPKAMALWLRTKGMSKNITDYLKNPLLFYGGLAGILGGGALLAGNLFGGNDKDDDDDDDDKEEGESYNFSRFSGISPNYF